MKYGKLVEKFLSQKSSQNNAQVAIALVAGLAAGAVISILFAPDKGTSTRKSIASKARNLGGEIRDSYTSVKNKILGNQDNESSPTHEVPHFTHTVAKKRKSDIKDLISESHHDDLHVEQN